MKTLTLITRVFADRLESAKGQSKAEHQTNVHQSHYKVKTDQFTFTIHCQEHFIALHYEQPWIPNEIKTMYSVHCEFPQSVPFEYQLQMQETMTFPLLTSKFCSGEVKRKAAIKAYLDIVLQRNPKQK